MSLTIIKLSKKWGIDDSISFIIGMNGGAMYDNRLHQKEEFANMDGELLLSVIKFIRQGVDKHFGKVHFEVMDGNTRYVEWSSPYTLENADLYGEVEVIKDLDSYMPGRRFDKLIIRSDPQDQPALIEYSKGYQSPMFNAFATANDLFEYVDPQINKGYGLQKICDHYGLDLAHVVAFGDEANDVEMLSLAGNGVAMKNATLPARMASNIILDHTNDEEGEEGATFNGVMTSMEELCKKYAATTGATKGILIERAGNKSSPLSLLQNTYLKQI